MPAVPSASPIEDLTVATVHFEIAQRDLIPGIASVRALCDVQSSGEPIVVLANGSARSTLAIEAGPCAIVVVLAGIDVAIPVFNTTPLGTNSFYLPGISTVSLGIVDLSLDLVTTLNSTSWIEDPIGEVSPMQIDWSAWGARRIQVHGDDGFGSVAASHLRTAFTFRMSLALSVYALSIRLYHQDLAEIGSAVGTPSLRTPFAVDLTPHALVLAPPEGISHDGATLSWSGTLDPDVDHLELWLVDDASNVSIRLEPSATQAKVLLRPATSYRAWIVTIDGAGQGTPSNGIAFESAAEPAGVGTAIGPSGAESLPWVLVALAGLVGFVGYAVWRLQARKEL